MIPDPKTAPASDDAEQEALEEAQKDAAEERKEGGYQ